MRKTTIYYFEMTDPAQLVEKWSDDSTFIISECKEKKYEFNRFLYQLVGKHWHWVDNLKWSGEKWKSFGENKNLRTWIAMKDNILAGYYELLKDENGHIEIAHIGLIPEFIGRGYGGHLLTHAIISAWEWSATRIYLNTCSLDHPNAIKNYEKRGMRLYRTEEREILEE